MRKPRAAFATNRSASLLGLRQPWACTKAMALRKGTFKVWLGDCDKPDPDDMLPLVRVGLRATQRHVLLEQLSNAM
jgi:hypothetical protein